MRYISATIDDILNIFDRLPALRAPFVSDPRDNRSDSVTWRVAEDRQSCYGVTDTGELIAVVSLVPGRGRGIIEDALNFGATWLQHFDIPALSRLYERAGFVESERFEFDRELSPVNWHPSLGTPDYIIRELSR